MTVEGVTGPESKGGDTTGGEAGGTRREGDATVGEAGRIAVSCEMELTGRKTISEEGESICLTVAVA